jgi:hypothetical protein
MENRRQNLEVANILQEYGAEFLNNHTLCHVQRKAFYDLMNCRTAQLGGHLEACDHCGVIRSAYNSCRNRHCPKCQFIKQVQWVDKLKSKLPPLNYYHVVFTIPSSLHTLFYLNQANAYHYLFKAASETLKLATANPKYLGAQTGAVALLHTWGQTLNYHPHIHMIIPAGGLAADDMEWIPTNKNFFLPVKVLSRLFRGLLCQLLQENIKTNRLILPDELNCFEDLKAKLYQKNWNVYVKRPLAGPEKVIEYLGQYTHRVAISNHRLLSSKQGKVTFSCKDSQTGKFTRKITLEADEFIRRFMQHILPTGFYKIRYFGFMALSHVRAKIDLCCELLDMDEYISELEGLSGIEVYRLISGRDPLYCPFCKKGQMRSIPSGYKKKRAPE